MDWADETTQRLISLWDQGLSTAEIGRRLGVSKNSVIGRAHRIGLTGRQSPIRRNGEPKVYVRKPRAGANTLPPLGSLGPSPKPQAPAKVYRPQSLQGYTRPATPAAAALDWPRVTTRVVVERPEPPKYGRVVNCCFPIGDVKSKDFRFCDKPSAPGKSYCPECCKRVYAPRRDAA
jgi:GcrA cell cycle regulator